MAEANIVFFIFYNEVKTYIMRKEIFFVFTLIILGVISLSLSSCTKDGESQTLGPQTPACGIVQVLTDEVIAGVQFPKGKYQINV